MRMNGARGFQITVSRRQTSYVLAKFARRLAADKHDGSLTPYKAFRLTLR